MPIVACPCGKKFRAIDSLAGKQVNCPGCGRPLLIPEASLLDEELARPVPRQPNAAPLPRSRIQQRSTAIEGWLLAVLLAGGGVVVLAILMTLFSMFSGDDGQRPDGELASNAPVEETASGAAVGETTSEPANVPEDWILPDPESNPPSTDTASDSAPEHDTSDPAPLSSSDEPAAEDPVPPPVEGSREDPPPAKPTSPSSRSNQPTADTIRLSRGVALAQTLPTGTAMGFSAEYEFVSHAPSGPVNLTWVVESAKGQAIRQPVQMTARGTLQGFVVQFRPEQAPFKTHIEDQYGNRLSKSLPLR